MFRYRALSSASTLVLCSTLSAIPSMTCAQTADRALPPVTIEAPNQRQALQPAKKPPPRTACRIAAQEAGRDGGGRPAGRATTAAAPMHRSGTPPIKQRFQLPQESFSITAKQIDETINLKDPEDAVKYLPSLFVRKRNDGDNQAVLATRTWGLNSSARTLIYYDDLLISALIGNNNSGASPHWNLISPEAIARIDFLNGPYAAAYPGNSIGGVLLITSKMPDKPFAIAKETVSVDAVESVRHQGHLCEQPDQRVGRRSRRHVLVAGQRQLSRQLSAAADLYDQWHRFPPERPEPFRR